MEVEAMMYDGTQYFILPDPRDSQRFWMYSPLDDLFRKRLGEVEMNPLTGRPSRVRLY